MPETTKPAPFADGIVSVTNTLANQRNVMNQNMFASHRLDDGSLRALWKNGLCKKIVDIKAGLSLNYTLQFKNDDDETLYQKQLERAVKLAARYMVGFGRGLICIWEPGETLSEPRRPGAAIKRGAVLQVFSGDMVSVGMVETALGSPRYQKPLAYIVRAEQFHYSRCIDFVYHRPAELNAPNYKYGGVSEFELIVQQLMADEVVQRAAPHVLEKSAQKVYKVPDFMELLQAGKHETVLEFFRLTEDRASVFGATVVDSKVDVTSLSQALSGMNDIDTFSLRRLAMVTGIPLALLVGENVKGLNSTGDQERASFQDMIETLQYTHLLEPIQDLCRLYGIDGVSFKDNQGGTALERAELDAKILANAQALMALGEDFGKYLQDNGMKSADPIGSLLDYPEVAEGEAPGPAPTATGAASATASVAEVSLNGAQLASLLSIIERVAQGQLPRDSALAIIRLAFPSVTQEQAEAALGSVGAGFVPAAPTAVPGAPNAQ